MPEKLLINDKKTEDRSVKHLNNFNSSACLSHNLSVKLKFRKTENLCRINCLIFAAWKEQIIYLRSFLCWQQLKSYTGE